MLSREEMKKLSHRDIRKLSDDDLDDYLDVADYSSSGRNFAVEEFNRRKLRSIAQPHWSLTPIFWVAVATLIFAAIAAWPVIRHFFQESQLGNKAANSQQPQPKPAMPPLPEPKTAGSSNHP
jgi:hypothetical protein